MSAVSGVAPRRARPPSLSFAQVHRRLAIFAGLGAIIWGLSGLCHPLMVNLGPQAAQPTPPADRIVVAGAPSPQALMSAAGIAAAADVRVVAADRRSLLRLVLPDGAAVRYVALDGTGLPPAFDRDRAVALARHYLALPDAPVAATRRIDAFDDDYPAVNQYLPVWQVRFDRADGLAAYVDTATGRLAAVDDSRKRLLQAIFRNLHSLAFLPAGAEWVQVVLTVALVGALAATATLGIGLLALLRQRRCLGLLRRWHRLAGYGLALPALMFSVSGLWTLVLNTMTPPDAPPAPTLWSAAELTAPLALLAGSADGTSGLRLVRAPDGAVLWRSTPGSAMRPAAAAHAEHQRATRFSGGPQTAMPIWLDAATGAVAPAATEQAVAVALAAAATGRDTSAAAITRLTGFDAEYGFINKRLPVFRVAFADGLRVFVDPGEGVIAKRLTDAQAIHTVLFSFLHKWRFLDPIGQFARDVVIMVVVSALVAMAVGGLAMLRRPFPRQRRRGDQPKPVTA